MRLTFSSWCLVLPVLAAAVFATAARTAPAAPPPTDATGVGTAQAGAARQQATRAVPEYGYKVVRVYPHDPRAFTQGLEFRAGVLYEGTGTYGHSSIRKVKLETGEVLEQMALDNQYFGEGITVLNERITQLTWKTEVGFVREQSSFKVLRQFNYPGEGWGLANDGTHIYMSDGTPQIRLWDPNTLKEIQRFTVRDGDRDITSLNELEFVRGEIYANVWGSDRIVRFSPKDGRVLGWIDLTGLLTPRERNAGPDVLNGIAYDAVGDRLFVTGKYWPKLFEIKLVPRPSRARS